MRSCGNPTSGGRNIDVLSLCFIIQHVDLHLKKRAESGCHTIAFWNDSNKVALYVCLKKAGRIEVTAPRESRFGMVQILAF